MRGKPRHLNLAAIVVVAAVVSNARVALCNAEYDRQRSAEDQAACFDMLMDKYELLHGRSGYHDDSIRELFKEIAKIPPLCQRLNGLMDEVKHLRAEINQKDLVIESLLKSLCTLSKELCDLRSRFEASEFERRQQDRLRENENTAPTLDPRFIAPQPPSQPSEDPYRVDPTPETVPLPQPRIKPISPLRVQPVWDGRITHIRDRRDSFCPNAVLIHPGYTFQQPNGALYFGDVYRTCKKNYVLLLRPIYVVYEYR